jgi:DNA-binding MarR family transcriptional regulator
MSDHMAVQDMAGHLIRRLHQQSTAIFAERTQAAGFDLTPVQFAALEAIRVYPGIDQSGVAEQIGYDRATIGGVIDRLLKKAWINRTTNAKDRRSRELSLTPQGRRVLATLTPLVHDLQSAILHPLSEADQSALLQLMYRVVWADKTSDT